MVSIHIAFTNSFDDYLEANRSHFWQAFRRSFVSRFLLAVILLAFAMLVWNLIRTPSNPAVSSTRVSDHHHVSGRQLAFNALPIVVVIVFAVVARRWSRRRTWQSDARHSQTRQVDIDEAGVRITMPASSATVSWSDFFRCLETKNLFLLYFSAASLLMIPKRVLQADDEQTLRTLLLRIKVQS